MFRFIALACGFSIFLGFACAKPAPPSTLRASVPPKPVIYVRTAEGLVPEDASEVAVQPYYRDHGTEAVLSKNLNDPAASWRTGEGLPEAVRLRATRPIGLGSPRTDGSQIEPIYPQMYYVRPEHTSTGYTEGRYGRIDNYTPGEHTSTGYTPGHYRGDGVYTRPEHTPTGYIPGHYRADPQPKPR